MIWLGSDIDFEIWDSDDEDDLVPLAENDDSLTNSDNERKNGPTPIKAMTMRKKKTARKKKSLGPRSHSVGDDAEMNSLKSSYVMTLVDLPSFSVLCILSLHCECKDVHNVSLSGRGITVWCAAMFTNSGLFLKSHKL